VERLSPKRILAFVPNWVGDAVMATPALAALRKRFPEARIVAAVRPYVSEILEGARFVDEVRGLDGLKTSVEARAFLRDTMTLRRERYDVAVLFTNSFRSALMAFLAGARTRVGYAREGRAWLLTERLEAKRADGEYLPGPMIDYYLELTGALGAETCDRRMRLAVTDGEAKAAADVVAEFHVETRKPMAVITPGAAFGSAKCWLAASFAAVADELSAKGYEVVVLTSPKERGTAELIGQKAKHALKATWRADMKLGTLKALISRAAVLVTNDSGPRHIGAAFGVPVVTIFGSTDERWSDTGYGREVIVTKNVDCAPCMLRVCPTDHRCMELITPGDVLTAVDEALTRPGVDMAG
jgi:heptosyltransferase-2